MTTPNPGICAYCSFWYKHGEHEGECRRYPPLRHFAKSEMLQTWPHTKDSDFCGEHHPHLEDKPREMPTIHIVPQPRLSPPQNP